MMTSTKSHAGGMFCQESVVTPSCRFTLSTPNNFANHSGINLLQIKNYGWSYSYIKELISFTSSTTSFESLSSFPTYGGMVINFNSWLRSNSLVLTFLVMNSRKRG